MAIIWVIEWNGITPETFGELSTAIGWETEPADGLQHQVTAFGEKSLLLTQVWESPEHVLQFMENRFLPAVEKLGIRSMPRIDQFQVHSIYSA